jgi:PAS domain S-box-containing protein
VLRGNRLLGGVGRLVVRERDRDALLRATCRLAVEAGELPLAVAVLHPAAGEPARLVAADGPAAAAATELLRGEDLAAMRAWAANPPAAIPVVDVESDERLGAAREVLLAAGVRASAALPLRVGDRVVGALRLGARERGFFAGAELETLTSVQEMLSFALEAIERDERRVAAEADAAERRDLLRGFMDVAAAGILAFGDRGVVVRTNPAASALLGQPADALLGRPIGDLLPGFAVAAASAQRDRASSAPQELVVARGGSSSVLEVSFTPFVLGGVPLTYAMIRDVTEQRQLEAEVRKAQRLDSLTVLAGGIAHDFNNLLLAILGFAGFLVEGLPEGSEGRSDALEIREAGERAAALIRKLVAFTRHGEIAPADLDLAELVRGVVRAFRGKLGDTVTIELVHRDADALVHADARQIEQVVAELLLNAVEAMPEGGALRIETGVEDVAAAPGPLAPEPGRYAFVRVVDRGTGMSPTTLARLFEPYFTTKERGRRGGLGLAASFGIVRQHHGSFRVHSVLGAGSSFDVLLPALPVPERSRRVSQKPVVAPIGGRILVAEDEPAVRRMAARALTNAGYEVVVAADGEEAFATLSAHPDDYSLLLTDVVMPRLGGVKLASKVRALRFDLPIVLMSGFADDPDVAALSLPREHFLAKPFTVSTLLGAVRSALAAAHPHVAP